MVRLLVAVECDYAGYEPFTANRCTYCHSESMDSVRRALDLVLSECNGRAAFLIHTSPYIRRNWNDVFYTSPDYLSMWNEVVAQGGELGLHLHEEEPDGSCLYYGYPEHLEKVVSDHVRLLEEAGLRAACESTGYFGMNEWLVPILEAHEILVNLDNIGTFTRFTGRNWAEAPSRPYFADRVDVARKGDSRVLMIPLGMTDCCRGEDGLMIGRNSLRYLKSLWREIRSASSGDSACYIWVEAHRIRKDERRLVSLLRWLKSEGAELATPTEVYDSYAAARAG